MLSREGNVGKAGRKPDEDKDFFAQVFDLSRAQRRDFSPSFRQQLMACKDNAARMILIRAREVNTSAQRRREGAANQRKDSCGALGNSLEQSKLRTGKRRA
jgi:hypothetical protein